MMRLVSWVRILLIVCISLLGELGLHTLLAQEQAPNYSYRDSLERSLFTYDCQPRKYRASCEAELQYMIDDEIIYDKYTNEALFELIGEKPARARDCVRRRYSSGYLSYENYAFANMLKITYRGQTYSLSSIDALSDSSIDHLDLSYRQDSRSRQEIMTMTVVEDITLDSSERFANPLILKAGSKIRFTVFLRSAK